MCAGLLTYAHRALASPVEATADVAAQLLGISLQV